MSDLRYALRSLRRTPVFTVVAVLSLALGAGANTAIFSLIDSIMLKMLPVDHPEQLVFVTTKPIEAGGVRIKINISNGAMKQMQQSAPQTAIASSYEENSKFKSPSMDKPSPPPPISFPPIIFQC